jgi:hypothetical protein
MCKRVKMCKNGEKLPNPTQEGMEIEVEDDSGELIARPTIIPIKLPHVILVESYKCENLINLKVITEASNLDYFYLGAEIFTPQ